MSLLTEYLDKHNIPYVRKEIQKPEGSGARVGVSREWEGTVIVVRETVNHTRALNNMREELQKNLNSCSEMRRLAKEMVVPCSSIDDEVFVKAGRDNDVCRRCAFGKSMEELRLAIESFYDTDEDEVRKLAATYFEEKVE